jgi:hypothetical protein
MKITLRMRMILLIGGFSIVLFILLLLVQFDFSKNMQMKSLRELEMDRARCYADKFDAEFPGHLPFTRRFSLTPSSIL